MFVTALMDVEDLIDPESDDIARDCATILSEEGVTATLCVVGEKARLLHERGRFDVIAALKEHDIGLHTNLHSVHPTIAEAMAARNWEDGAAEAERMERPGAEAIERVFGRKPSCWGGPGNTWGPQLCEALGVLGIPAFVYAHTCVPDGGPHRFAGRIAYPNGPSLSDGRYHDDSLASQDRAVLVDRLKADMAAGIRWRQVFLGHPTRILHSEFWDAPNFALGANPPRNDWTIAPRKSKADLDCALKNFRRAVQLLRSLSDIELRTIDQMNQELESCESAPLSAEEQAYVWPTIERNLQEMKSWPILPSEFDPSHIVDLTEATLPTLMRFV
jgi:hypothetical protein